MEDDNETVDLPVERTKPVRLDFPRNATAKEIAAAIESMRAAAGYGPTFDEKKQTH